MKKIKIKSGNIFGILAFVIIAIILIIGLFTKYQNKKADIQDNNTTIVSATTSKQTTKKAKLPIKKEEADKKYEVEVHYIDVGQGDSTLIKNKEKCILIDCGTYDHGKDVCNYLNKIGVGRLDLIIATHPDADHIGGFNYLLDNIGCEQIILPQTPDTIKRTKTELTFVNKAKTYKIPLEYAITGKQYNIGEMLLTTYLTEGMESKEKNDYSVVTRIQYKKASYLFMGDAGINIEKEFMNKKYDLKSDILKVGHHGSSKSTCEAFLKYVEPEYAVISCGKGNDYGHPHNEVLFNLEEERIGILRTDEQGTIIIQTDGNAYYVTAE